MIVNRRTFLSGLAAALVAANTVLGFSETELELKPPEADITSAALWDRVLTDEDVRRYHEGLMIPRPPLTYWRRMDG